MRYVSGRPVSSFSLNEMPMSPILRLRASASMPPSGKNMLFSSAYSVTARYIAPVSTYT